MLYARKCFYKFDTKDPLNSEAANLYENDNDSFKDAAKACVQAWKERLYDEPSSQDPHYPAFSPYQPKLHEPVKATMLAEARKHEVSLVYNHFKSRKF